MGGEFLALLEAYPTLLYLLVGLFALAVGSFLNVVIHRLPLMMERGWREECQEYFGAAEGTAEGAAEGAETAREPHPFNLAQPRSRCPHCGHAITALQNIPLLSYLLLRGRCAGCAAPISLRYPLVELLTALLSLVVVWRFGLSWQMVALLPLTWALIALSVIDYDHQLLPDSIVLPFLWLGLVISLFGWFVPPATAILGAVVGYLSLWSVFQLFKLLTGKEGMGYGDFKLLALFGAWGGWANLLQIVLLSSLVGAIIGLALILLWGRERSRPMPFGPFIAIAGWISLLWGDEINRTYLQLTGLG